MRSYPLQVTVHHVDVVHVLQSICGIDELNEGVKRAPSEIYNTCLLVGDD